MFVRSAWVMLAAALIACSIRATGLPPGFPSRAADLDVLPGFKNPPAGYGEVSFYWWLGDPLTKERLTWQLDQLKNKSISALQVNYAHSDKGGKLWGLTYESEPRLFSEPWWNLFSWFLQQSKQRGMAVSLSDYTLGWAGNGWYTDEMLRARPDLQGSALARESHDCAGECSWQPHPSTLTISAYRLDNSRIVPGSPVDLRENLQAGVLKWSAPPGEWRVIAVYPRHAPSSIDPMHPLSGKEMIDKFFQRFESRNPGESGRGLNFFFSDELNFGVRGWLWNRYFSGEFQKRKGYDVVPELASLFEETGPRAVKVRLDYSDVMVALSEENYFRPLYEWHNSRGMLYGCDHGGRGRDVTEFGDYFRTQRWVTGPGNDQPGLDSNTIKNKVASSIAHLYERPRTWLEGFYSSGWGTTSAQIVDATWRNFAQGHNLLTLHGLYYSTKGGWWEWAPPCNHFRMPYWAHMGEFLRASERMSYLLSQGHHRADVAILYPVAAMEAGSSGKESVNTAFDLATYLYAQGIDFDFIDFESLARARVQDRKLKVAGEEYRVLVLPAMRAVRHSTIEKAAEFHRAGGLSVILGAAPQASDRLGAGDSELLRMSEELARAAVKTKEEVAALVNRASPRDFVCEGSPQPSILHRKAGPRDIYMVYGAAKGRECSFRSAGAVELWDPWTGSTRELSAASQSGGATTLRMPLDATEAQLVVFNPGTAKIAVPEKPGATLSVEGPWEFELVPTLDNRFGDYRLPETKRLIGAEARRLRYSEDESFGNERTTTYGYGPRFWKLGPLPANLDTSGLEREIGAMSAPDLTRPVLLGGREYKWTRYDFSTRFGIEGDPGHQGYHGLKAIVGDDFIGLGALQVKQTTTVYTAEPEGTRYYLWTSVESPRDMRARVVAGGELLPRAFWINGAAMDSKAKDADLRQGSNALLVRYDQPGRGHFALLDPRSPADWKQTYPLSSEWHNRPGLLPFDIRPGETTPNGWYRTTAPPGTRAMNMVVRGAISVWFDGQLVPARTLSRREDGAMAYRVAIARPKPSAVPITIRVNQERGAYAGAAFVEPVQFECAAGVIDAGDWSRIEGLANYSGGAWYRKQVTLTSEQAQGIVALDLGQVSASAEVRINGRPAGIKLAPPFRVDVAGLIRPGVNRIEVLVYTALSNHYTTIPTKYRKHGPSGLLGPVRWVASAGK